MTTHSHAGVSPPTPPQSGRPPSPRGPLPHLRPPRHRLLHALVHRPQGEADPQLCGHAASSPHPPGPNVQPGPPLPRLRPLPVPPSSRLLVPNHRSPPSRLSQSSARGGTGTVRLAAPAPAPRRRHLGKVSEEARRGSWVRSRCWRRSRAGGKNEGRAFCVRRLCRPRGTEGTQKTWPMPEVLFPGSFASGSAGEAAGAGDMPFISDDSREEPLRDIKENCKEHGRIQMYGYFPLVIL